MHLVHYGAEPIFRSYYAWHLRNFGQNLVPTSKTSKPPMYLPNKDNSLNGFIGRVLPSAKGFLYLHFDLVEYAGSIKAPHICECVHAMCLAHLQ